LSLSSGLLAPRIARKRQGILLQTHGTGKRQVAAGMMPGASRFLTLPGGRKIRNPKSEIRNVAKP
jgi:hypothetical protein